MVKTAEKDSVNDRSVPIPSRHIGGSLLPSSDPAVLKPMADGPRIFQVRALPELDTHALMLNMGQGEMALAMHANGYSCHELAKRMIHAWADPTPEKQQRALDQFDYILRCGGLGMQRAAIESIACDVPQPDAADAADAEKSSARGARP